MKDKKTILLLVVSVLLGISIIIISVFSIKEFKKKELVYEENEVRESYLLIDETTTSKKEKKHTTKSTTSTPKKSSTTTSTTKSVKQKKVNQTTKSTTKTSKTNNTTTKAIKYRENDVINYAKESYNEASTSDTLTSKIKTSFITLVDFIFYDGEIKGYKFSDLTKEAKAKVIYYTLKMDNFIEEKFPEYKEKISAKVSDLKQKLVAKYMDLTFKICKKNEHACEETKANYEELKRDVKLTWKIISSSAKYGASKLKDNIKNWYEVFSGKI